MVGRLLWGLSRSRAATRATIRIRGQQPGRKLILFMEVITDCYACATQDLSLSILKREFPIFAM